MAGGGWVGTHAAARKNQIEHLDAGTIRPGKERRLPAQLRQGPGKPRPLASITARLGDKMYYHGSAQAV